MGGTEGASDVVRVDVEALRRLVTGVFTALELPSQDAAIVADALVEADLLGVSSHGVSNYIELLYVPGLREGHIRARPAITTVHETPVTALVDGGGGMGHVVGHRAMVMAIGKAKEHGVGMVTVRNSRHYGMAGYYSLMALEHDMIGISMTNADRLVLPTFGRESRIGTNPISVAVPSGEEEPYLLDMATSTVPFGKVMLAHRAGQPIPEGWAADEAGRLTTDASAALRAMRLSPLGATYVMGGHKGYSLGVLVDVLCGVLSGAGGGLAGNHLGSPVGHFFGAIRIDAFRPLHEFQQEMDRYQRYLLETESIDEGEPVIYAGIKEARSRADCLANGVPLHGEVVRYLRELAGELGVDASQLSRRAHP